MNCIILYIFLLIFAHGFAKMKLPVTEMSSMEYSHSKIYKLKATVETKVVVVVVVFNVSW